MRLGWFENSNLTGGSNNGFTRWTIIERSPDHEDSEVAGKPPDHGRQVHVFEGEQGAVNGHGPNVRH